MSGHDKWTGERKRLGEVNDQEEEKKRRQKIQRIAKQKIRFYEKALRRWRKINTKAKRNGDAGFAHNLLLEFGLQSCCCRCCHCRRRRCCRYTLVVFNFLLSSLSITLCLCEFSFFFAGDFTFRYSQYGHLPYESSLLLLLQSAVPESESEREGERESETCTDRLGNFRIVKNSPRTIRPFSVSF